MKCCNCAASPKTHFPEKRAKTTTAESVEHIFLYSPHSRNFALKSFELLSATCTCELLWSRDKGKRHSFSYLFTKIPSNKTCQVDQEGIARPLSSLFSLLPLVTYKRRYTLIFQSIPFSIHENYVELCGEEKERERSCFEGKIFPRTAHRRGEKNVREGAERESERNCNVFHYQQTVHEIRENESEFLLSLTRSLSSGFFRVRYAWKM
jgi:hypothetical protein